MNTASQDLAQVVKTTPYPIDAFFFVQRGLEFTVRSIHGEEIDDAADLEDLESTNRHVTGRDLCKGLRDYALAQYGFLARTVLKRWRITECEDFGRIVFAMVDGGLMRKTQEDTLEDFQNVFDFAAAFEAEFSIYGAGH